MYTGKTIKNIKINSKTFRKITEDIRLA